MNKTIKKIVGFVILFAPALQLSAQERNTERFKNDLLQEIKKEIKDLSDEEIRTIIDAVEENITAYFEHYEETPAADLLTKDQKLLEDHAAKQDGLKVTNGLEASVQQQQQIVLDQIEPKLSLLPQSERTKPSAIARTAYKKDSSNSHKGMPNEGYDESWRWSLLSKGDVLVNLDNGMLGFKWGHVGMMFDKGNTPEQSRTIEILGYGDVVQFKNYKTTWHDNRTNRISHNYVSSVWGTDIPDQAADVAIKWLGKGYSLWPILGDTSSFYCTELVFMAYKELGVNLGNGMDIGSFGILMPKSMYCSPELASYYRQNMSGRAGNVC